MNLLLRGLLYFPLINQGYLSAESFSYSFQNINPIRAFSRCRQACSSIQSSTSGTILENRSFACSVQNSLIAPPEKLRTLKTLDEEFHPLPDTPILIKRISFQPEMFVVKNLLPFEADRTSLMESAISSEMREASTKSGIVSHRTDCYVASLNCNDSSNISKDEGEQVASFLEQFLAYLFTSSPSSGKIKAEPMQILCYEPNGKYDFHHDGYQRIFTVITYLNGVAGTWFPYAVISASTIQEDEEETPPQMKLSGEGMAVDKLPGKDGVLVIGKMDHKYINEAECDNRHVVQIEPGDAIVFYNYQWADKQEVRGDLGVHHSKSDSGEHALTMNWRSLHCGLPASQEKWIATKWFVYDGDNEH